MHRLLGLLALTALHAASDGEQVIRDAYARYEGRWFRSLTFVQKTTFADGRVETWYESLVLPGRLRIDYAPAEAGRAVIFRNDSLYAYRGGTLQGAQGRAHPLLVVLYDLHAQDPELTIARLRTLGFDLSKVHRTRWQGDSVIVVGATAGDTTSRQVWFDARRLIAVRLIDPGPQGLADTQIGGYAAVGPWWHERDIIFRVNGKVTLREEYTDVQIDAPLPASVFEPGVTLARPAWVGELAPRWPQGRRTGQVTAVQTMSRILVSYDDRTSHSAHDPRRHSALADVLPHPPRARGEGPARLRHSQGCRAAERRCRATGTRDALRRPPATGGLRTHRGIELAP